MVAIEKGQTDIVNSCRTQAVSVTAPTAPRAGRSTRALPGARPICMKASLHSQWHLGVTVARDHRAVEVKYTHARRHSAHCSCSNMRHMLRNQVGFTVMTVLQLVELVWNHV